MQITEGQVLAIGGKRARRDIARMIAAFINEHGNRYRLDTAQRVKHFLGQCAVESAYFSRLEENLNYSAKRLKQVWPARFKNPADVRRCAGNPRALANHVYGGRMGNRGKADAGWLYRGSSTKQITGYDNFAAFTAWIRSIFPDAPDFTREPDKLRSLEWAVWPAAWYWVERECWRFADRDDVTGLTRRINGGTNGLKERTSATAKAGRVLNMTDLPKPAPKKPDKADPLLRETQARLKQLAERLGVPELDPGRADGWNGPKTIAAVSAFQRRYNLEIDGIAGPKTRAALEHALKAIDDAPPEQVPIDKPVVPETVDDEVKKKTGRWGWLTTIFGGGGAGAAALFGMDWQTIAAIGGVSLVALVVIILLRRQIAAAIRDIRAEIEGAA